MLFKLPTLDQLFCPNEQDERAVGRSQHTVILLMPMLLYSAASLAVSVILRWMGTVLILSSMLFSFARIV